jgi:hypothetical protein
VLLAENDLVGGPDDVVRQDPEVRQARKIADAARSRLLTCIAGSEEVVDMVATQRIFDMLGEAQALAEDAEDRVLAHRGLLSPAEAGRRAAARRPAAPRASALPALQFKPGPMPTLPPAARRVAANVIIHALIPAAAGFAGAAIAKRGR